MIKYTLEIKDEFTQAISTTSAIESRVGEAKIVTSHVRVTIKSGTTIMDNLRVEISIHRNRLS